MASRQITFTNFQEVCVKEETLPFQYRVNASNNQWIPIPSEWTPKQVYAEIERQMQYTNFFEVRILIGKVKKLFTILKDNVITIVKNENVQNNNTSEKNWQEKYKDMINTHIDNERLKVKMEFAESQINILKSKIEELENENEDLYDQIETLKPKEGESTNVGGIKDETFLEKILNFPLVSNVLKDEQIAHKIAGYLNKLLPDIREPQHPVSPQSNIPSKEGQM